MKSSRILLTVLFTVIFGVTTSAQHNHSGMGSGSGMNMNMSSPMNTIQHKTSILKVGGKCEMCKARIEQIAIKAGANSAEWNIKTKVLTVNFDPTKSSEEYISKKLVKAGHDAGSYSAKDKAYNALPDCCKYERIR